jgi:hypothetical protein
VEPDQTLSQPLGSDRPWFFTLKDSDNVLVDDYTDTDPLTCVIWSGQDQASLATPAATWVDVTQGTVQVVVAASDVASLLPGVYRMVCRVNHTGSDITFFDGSIELTPAPGMAAALTAYCTFDDLVLYAPQIRQFHDPRVDLAGFLGERARARTCTNEMILDGYRPSHGRARRGVSADGTTAGPYLRWVTSGPNGEPTPALDDLRGYVAAGGLKVTDKIREANAHAAAAIVYLNQPGANNPYNQLGQRHWNLAQSLMASAVIEIDVDNDQVADIRVGQDVTWLA